MRVSTLRIASNMANALSWKTGSELRMSSLVSTGSGPQKSRKLAAIAREVFSLFRPLAPRRRGGVAIWRDFVRGPEVNLGQASQRVWTFFLDELARCLLD